MISVSHVCGPGLPRIRPNKNCPTRFRRVNNGVVDKVIFTP